MLSGTSDTYLVSASQKLYSDLHLGFQLLSTSRLR